MKENAWTKESGWKTVIRNLFQYGCYAFFGLCAVYLTVLSLFSTSSVQLKRVMSEGEAEWFARHVFFLPDSPWRHLAAGVLALLLFSLVRNLASLAGFGKKKGRFLWLFLPFLFLCTVFVFWADLYPASDPSKILRIARQVKEQNLEQFAVGGYMHRYPDQTGIVLFYYVFHCLFGRNDYLAIQIWNALLLTGAYFLLGRIADLLWGGEDKMAQGLTWFFCLAFFPMTLYVTFVYGTIPGLFFSILAFYLELEYMGTGKLAYGIAAAAGISFAILWKTNSLVMFVAMCIFLMYDFVMEKGERKKKTLLVIVALFALQRGATWTVNGFMEGLTGVKVAQGMPKTAWVAMALRDRREAPGSWDGYSVSLYERNGYDYKKTNEAAKRKIAERMQVFWDDRSYGVDFFGRKNCAQWNDPAFGSLSAVDGREEDGRKKLDNLCHGPLKYSMEAVANELHSLILIGVCFYLILGRKRQKKGEMLLGITTVGGAIFHTFWEAKPQYVLPYFVLLLPYCARGYSAMAQRLLALWKERKEDVGQTKKRCLQAAAGAGIICAFLGMISLLSGFRIISYTVHVQDGPEYLEQYEEAVQRELEEYKERQE